MIPFDLVRGEIGSTLFSSKATPHFLSRKQRIALLTN